MTEAEANRWAKERKAGRWRFILSHGLGWGVVVFFLNAVWAFFDGTLSLEWVAFNLVGCLAGGLALYTLLWWVYERLYRARRRDAV